MTHEVVPIENGIEIWFKNLPRTYKVIVAGGRMQTKKYMINICFKYLTPLKICFKLVEVIVLVHW